MKGSSLGPRVHQLSRHWAGNRLIVSLHPTSARLRRRPCGVAWDADPEPMVEYIDPDFLHQQQCCGSVLAAGGATLRSRSQAQQKGVAQGLIRPGDA